MKIFELSEFAVHLGNLAAGLAQARRDALDRAAQLIKAEAMSEVERCKGAAGNLQDTSYKDEELQKDADCSNIKYCVAGSLAHVHSDLPGFESWEFGTSRGPRQLLLGGSAFRKAPDVCNLIGVSFINYLVGTGTPRSDD
jgi:hypothetical protein